MYRLSFRALLLFSAVFVVALRSFAATPASGSLSGTAASVNWSGGPYTAVATDTSSCTTLNCDTFYLTINTPSGFFASLPNDEVQIRITWQGVTNEFDLYLFDPSGNLIASSAQAFETYEEIDAGPLPNGTYKVVVVASQTVNVSYSGTAQIALDPTIANGKARYQPGKIAFGTPFELPRPNDPANSGAATLVADQDVEPRVVHDSLGNLYAAAIQGVPGGVDVWKSYDGGKSFTYLGQPDGTQVVATTGTTTGNGLGGGDEDLAVGTSGNVYMNSLWLGSTTQASSFNGGSTWAVNPLASDIPGNDRQWIASYGDKTLYLTYKQLGADLSGTVSVVVVKSTDGGLTFPQITQVTTPVSGVQPGDQGNIVVDPRNGNVYNVFFDQTSTQVYLARSTDGGVAFDLKLVYQGPADTSLAHVFPAIAVDDGGNLHVVFSDGVNTYLTASRDQGATWSHVARVNNGASTRTAIQPWVVAGDPGKVNMTWLGSSATNFMDSSAQWQVFLAQSQNDLASVPTFTQSTVTGVVHVGPVCVNGLGCASGTRTLAEYWAPDAYLDGNALIVYPDDKNSGLPSGDARTWFVRQTAGPTIIQTAN
jgi:hypothetical protein